MLEQQSSPLETSDLELEKVFAEIIAIKDLDARTHKALRRAIENVLQGDRTRRYSITQLTPEEKKHIGTQVETELKKEFFQNRKGKISDTTIADVEVDIKNTIGFTWMIPTEAINRICLVVKIQEETAKYSMGLIRPDIKFLNKENQDKKRSISSEGQKSIRWIIKDALLMQSIFTTDTSTRERVFAQNSGQAAVKELFKCKPGIPIERSDLVLAAAHKDGRQVDFRARVRDAQKHLAAEGLRVLRGWNPLEREESAQKGYFINTEQCIALRGSNS